MPKKHTGGNFIKVENLINVCVYKINESLASRRGGVNFKY